MDTQDAVLDIGNEMLVNEGGKIDLRLFTASFDLKNHPLLKLKSRFCAKYFAVLEHFVRECVADNVYVNQRLDVFRRALLGKTVPIKLNDRNKNRMIRSILNSRLKPWLKQYSYLLFCDIALILVDECLLQSVYAKMKEHLTNQEMMDELKDALLSDKEFKLYAKYTKNIAGQYYANRMFWRQMEKRFMVTANMSAGKSTLVNALVGKTVSGMKSEAFTAGIHYIYDKPFEDGRSSEWDGILTMEANDETLTKYDIRNETGTVFVSTYFSTLAKKGGYRFCLIDTPGVNSAVNYEHGRLTIRSLKEESYDGLIYVFNAARLGTEDEYRYLKLVAETVPKEKVVFVLNKLDGFRQSEDCIAVSIERIRKDLVSLGYNNPIICPVSAYCGLLVKKCLNGTALSEDEQDLFKLFSRKLCKAEYDLSRYYPLVENIDSSVDSQLLLISMQCGLYGLESILMEV